MPKVFFWTHLTAGVVSGILILIMCITGVALTFERQINTWADHRGITAISGSTRLPAEDLLAKVAEQRPGGNALTIYSDPTQPVEVLLGREGSLFVNPYTGTVLGQTGASGYRSFFRSMEDWHRWLAQEGPNRAFGRSIMDAANVIFFGITISGLYLWFPRKMAWTHFKPALLFRGGLTGKARDWNWHNVIGVWSWVPMFLIVGSGVVISYPWASNLLYTMTNSPNPASPGEGRGGPPGSGGGHPVVWTGVSAALATAEKQVPGWASIRVQGTPNANAPFSFSIDRGNGGQPQLRGTLVVNRESGEVVRWADWSSNSTGQQLRLLARFTHTGESLGMIGQIIAGVATAGGAVMVWTGIALTLRRFLAWRKRRQAVPETRAQAA